MTQTAIPPPPYPTSKNVAEIALHIEDLKPLPFTWWGFLLVEAKAKQRASAMIGTESGVTPPIGHREKLGVLLGVSQKSLFVIVKYPI